MDAAAIPAVLAYKGGELVANLVSIVDEIPSHLDMDINSIEAVLQESAHFYNVVVLF